MKRSRSPGFARPAIAVGLAIGGALLTAGASAQTWAVTGSTNQYTYYNLIAPGCVDTNNDTQLALVPGYMGSSLGMVSTSGHVCAATSCELGAAGITGVWVYGAGTNTVRVQWVANAHAQHSCYNRQVFKGEAIANLTAALGLTPTGVPAGTNVNITYRWRVIAWNGHKPEVPGAPDDINALTNTYLTVGATPVYNGTYDLINIKGALIQPDAAATLPPVPVNTNIPLGLGVNTHTDMNNPGEGPYNNDGELISYWGEVVLRCSTGINPPPPPPAVTTCTGTQQLEFSLDIGSDSALGDPAANGNEFFDPGDSYLWHGPALTAPTNGFRDDALIFGFDPAPSPAAAAIPVCAGAPLPIPGVFDLDDEDSIDIVIRNLPGYNPNLPFPQPIPEQPSTCIYGPEYLLISYDDDGPMHYTGNGFSCQTPTTSTAASGRTYGSANGHDEVLSMTVIPTPTGNQWGVIPFLSEFELHQSLWPEPNTVGFAVQQANNDDVDALDVNSGGCGVWMFTADHEASMGLDPGDVYEAGWPVRILSHSIHLGLPDGVDIRGLEFVWYGPPGQRKLTLLFTVAPDDPLTAVNESGGLNPAMIYASYMTGTYFPFLASPLPDPVDAIAACCVPMGSAPKAPAVFDSGYTNTVQYDAAGGCAMAQSWVGLLSGAIPSIGAPQRWVAQPFSLQNRTTITEIDPQGFTVAGGEFTALHYAIWNRLPGNPAPVPANLVSSGVVPMPAYTDDTDHHPNILGVVARIVLPNPLTLNAGNYYLSVYGDTPVVAGGDSKFGWFINAQLDVNQVPVNTPIPLFAFGGPGGGGEFTWRSLTYPAPGFAVYAPGLCTINIDPAPFYGPVPQNEDYRFCTAFMIRGIVPLANNCYANCDHSVVAPCLNVLDFACFLNKFAAGDPDANCDHSVVPPVLNVNDFSCFLNLFAAGCNGC